MFGPTIGLRGSVKKIQGRHDAVRLLVQFSVIQLVGRFLDLPYWQLVDGLDPDPVVMEALRTGYQQKDNAGQILVLKRLLWLHGHPVAVNEQLDAETRAVLTEVDATFDRQTASVPVETFLKLYLSVPLTTHSMEQANRFDRRLAAYLAPKQAQKEPPALKDMEPPALPQKQKSQKQSQSQPTTTQDKPIEKRKNTAQKSNSPATETVEKSLPETKPAQGWNLNEPPSNNTPLDIKTDYSLRRIIQHITDKQAPQSTESGQPYQSVSLEQ